MDVMMMSSRPRPAAEVRSGCDESDGRERNSPRRSWL